MREVLDAAETRQVAVWLDARVHRAGEVPASPVTPYNVISCDSGMPENYRIIAQHGSRQFRVIVQSVGATVGECAFAIEKADAAFLDHALTVDGFDAAPCRLEIPGSPRRDQDAGGLMYALSTYTFTAVQEDD